MEGSDYLLTCAEVGVALAGFSALVVAIRQRSDEELSLVYRRFVAALIERGLMATFFSLLPVVLSGLGVGTGTLWLGASLALAFYIGSMAWRSSAARSHPELRSIVPPAAFATLMAVGVAVLAVQVAHALALGITQSVWWDAVGVTWVRASGGYMFLFLVRDWTRRA